MNPLKEHEIRYLYVGIFAFMLVWMTRFFFGQSSDQITTPHFMLLHTLLVLLGTFISFSVFAQSVSMYSSTPKNAGFFIGLLFFAVGSFDFQHALFYKGMPFLNDEFIANRATWYWIVARLAESAGLCLAILIPHKLRIKYCKGPVLITFLTVSLISAVIFFQQDRLPTLVDSLTRMTILKVMLEYTICLILLVTFFILIGRYKQDNKIETLRLCLAVFIIMAGELFFIFYKHIYDVGNLIGHVYRLVGYIYLFRAISFPQFQRMLTEKKEAETKWMEAEHILFEAEKNMSRLVLQVYEEERRRVSRELHDGIGQSLYSILVTLTIADNELPENNKSESLQKAKRMTADAMVEIKAIAHALRPSSLDDLGFVPALKTYIEDFQRVHGIQVEFEFMGDRQRLDPEIEIALYRICQESLTNSAKYAQADSIRLTINNKEEEIQLTIKDSGVGFTIENYVNDSSQRGIGLFSMKERAEVLGGSFELNSSVNDGTTIIVRITKQLVRN